ncbi:MAG: N-acetyltransferase [Clostridia bacterium]|nr:N-acetyltransferase [Clostridia bacterium]MBQ5771468.1 N-acetyltransferase [Clostridia bacterium]
MTLTYRSMSDKYLDSSLELVRTVFTEHENAEEGKLVRALVEEIRSLPSYLPELELIAVDENDDVVGYAMMSGFHLNGNYKDRLLILTPVCVKTALQRRHISKNLLEYGFEKAVEMGYEAVIVEGNPANYRSRGFVTSSDHGIYPGKSVHLPSIECLMVKELKEGALKDIKGEVEYTDYKTLA